MPYDPTFPSQTLRMLEVRTELQLGALRQAVAPQAERHGERLAPPPVVADAASLLADVRRVMAREPGWRDRLALAPRPSWATLSIKLALAARALSWFSYLYMSPPIDDGEDDEEEDAAPGPAGTTFH